MHRLSQMYNGISAQINITQANLNMLYRRLDTVEQLLLDCIVYPNQENQPTNNISRGESSTSRPLNEDPQGPPTTPTISQNMIRPELRPQYTSSLSSNVRNTSINRQPISVGSPASLPRVDNDPVNFRFHIRTNSDNSLQDSSSILENIILALLNGSGTESETEGVSPNVGITDSERNQYITGCNFEDVSNTINVTCPITMDRFEPNTKVLKINSCGHIFSEDGLVPWISMRRCCPICRTSIVPLIE